MKKVSFVSPAPAGAGESAGRGAACGRQDARESWPLQPLCAQLVPSILEKHPAWALGMRLCELIRGDGCYAHSPVLSVILLERGTLNPPLQVEKLRLRNTRNMAEIWKMVRAGAGGSLSAYAVQHCLLGVWGRAPLPGFARLCPASAGLISALRRVVLAFPQARESEHRVLVRLPGRGLPQAKAMLDLSWTAAH